MPFPPDVVASLATCIRDDGKTPQSLDAFLERLAAAAGPDAALLEIIREKARMQKAREVLEAQQGWFDSLGWYLARLFMWGSLGGAIVCLGIWGRTAADPFTFGMAGAAIYYLLIQVFTPRRLARDRAGLEALAENRHQEMLAHLEALERNDGSRR
ncbi:MAG: hypothetical protein GX442_04280 [Candidatus Riflebacteria bacterium]|nr:hypothetical protein [Candidatus Riflebacteria bacterium]